MLLHQNYDNFVFKVYLYVLKFSLALLIFSCFGMILKYIYDISTQNLKNKKLQNEFVSCYNSLGLQNLRLRKKTSEINKLLTH